MGDSFPAWVATVGSMKATRDSRPDHYAVHVACTRCGMRRDVDLDALIAAKGPRYSLVNKRFGCRLIEGCRGWNRFFWQSGVMRPLWDKTTGDRWFNQDCEREARERVARDRLASLLRGGREVRFDPSPNGIDPMLWAIATDEERRDLIRRRR